MSRYPLRIDDVLKEQLMEIAKIEKRSFNSLVEVILTDHVDNKLADYRLKNQKRVSIKIEDL